MHAIHVFELTFFQAHSINGLSVFLTLREVYFKIWPLKCKHIHFVSFKITNHSLIFIALENTFCSMLTFNRKKRPFPLAEFIVPYFIIHNHFSIQKKKKKIQPKEKLLMSTYLTHTMVLCSVVVSIKKKKSILIYLK